MTIPDEAVQADTHATAARLNRLLTVCHGLRWTDVGVLSLENESTKKALGDLSEILFMDGIDEVVSGKSTTAALPFLQGVKVKALEWRDVKDTTHCIASNSVPQGLGSPVYVVFNNPYPDRKMHSLKLVSGGIAVFHKYGFSTLEAAKAAAQADCEARILSAIEQAPSPRAQALEEEEFAIDKLRFRAFHTNSDADRQAYFDAVSKWFQGRHYRRMNAERALSQPVADGWLPIETAPKDGTSILAIVSGKHKRTGLPYVPEVVEWTKYGWSNEMWGEEPNHSGFYPTHWRPLPASPGASE